MSKKDSKIVLYVDGNSLSTTEVFSASENDKIKISISAKVRKGIQASRNLLDQFVADKRVIYGVNTSLGGFINWLIPTEHAQKLQENLIAAVATNVGPYLDDRIVRASMLARINSLARGASAISIENFDKLVQIYNAGIIPCVPSKGSLGASGDLGPLACIALVGVGRWKAKYQGNIMPGRKALKQACIEPMKLSYKEGLSLINGTSTMAAFAALLVEQTANLIKTYDIITCLTFEGLKVKKKPFNPIVHRQKPHPGQLRTAENIWKLLGDSAMIGDEEAIEKDLQTHLKDVPTSANTPIEDAYSIRCTPHILGPIRDNLLWIQSVVTNELNSSNDNPLILADCGDIFHNGHFHGQYISMVMDHLGISLTTLSNLSDRRIDRFMDKHHNNHLPPFLSTPKPSLQFGLMGGQFMATSLTAENRSLCHPLSIQSLTSTGDFQDIVSLGLVAARRANEILENTVYILAFELLCGVQAAEYRGIQHLSKSSLTALQFVRSHIEPLPSNENMTNSLETLASLIKTGQFLQEVEKVIGKVLL